MKLTFVSNYLNHHQIPFCDALYELSGGSFRFIQTEPVAQERVNMGWKSSNEKPYLKLYYEDPQACQELILESAFVLFGGTDDESYIAVRLDAGKPVFRYSERLYRTGQWKMVSPKGLRKKYHDHIRYRNSPVYLLCTGAYVASDYGLIHAYPGKMFCWGYFPETKHYNVDKLMKEKGRKDTETLYLLWAGRFLRLKHPELAVETAAYLKERNVRFQMDIIGGGEMESEIRQLIRDKDLESYITLRGFMKPDEVRGYMEKAHIFLFTSNREEGWGAVANESMNSGCALIANHHIGSSPYLIRHGENGFVYRDGHKEQLFELAYRLSTDAALREKIGRNAYRTITEAWNPENAARQLLGIMERIENHDPIHNLRREKNPFPGAAEAPIRERDMYRYMMSRANAPK